VDGQLLSIGEEVVPIVVGLTENGGGVIM